MSCVMSQPLVIEKCPVQYNKNFQTNGIFCPGTFPYDIAGWPESLY